MPTPAPRPAVDTVALSGGVFQNVLLLRRSSPGSAAGFRVLTHSRVPPNDAGISLGQVAVAAAARDASGLIVGRRELIVRGPIPP